MEPFIGEGILPGVCELNFARSERVGLWWEGGLRKRKTLHKSSRGRKERRHGPVGAKMKMTVIKNKDKEIDSKACHTDGSGLLKASKEPQE